MQSSPDLTPLMGEMMLCSPFAATVLDERLSPLSRKLYKISRSGWSNSSKPSSSSRNRDRRPDPAAEAEAAKLQQQMQLEGAKGQAQIQSLQQKGQIEAQKGEMEAQKGQIELAPGAGRITGPGTEAGS